MILLFIITSVLYLIMMFFVITLYYTYRKDIEELENRILQIEKRLPNKLYKEINDKELKELVKQHQELMDKAFIFKEGDNTMACKGKKKK